MKSSKIHPRLKRKYNACYRARKKGYTINTNTKTVYRNNIIDKGLEAILNEYGFIVQLKLFESDE